MKENEDTVKTTLELPASLWEALRIESIRERRPMKELVAEAIAEWLRRREEKKQ